MRISRIFYNAGLASNADLTLDGATAHYIGTVLRLGAGNSLILFNGDGHEYDATVLRADKRSCSLRIGARSTPSVESALHSVLGLGISRGERMDWAIQKSTELGVNVIAPLLTEHCEVRLNDERRARRVEHWRQIAISACEQSGRVRVPEILEPQRVDAWIDSRPAELCLVLDRDEPGRLSGSRPAGGVALLVGPEGGLSASELALARARGFLGIALGKRTLRTETAPVAALSILQHLWG